jgi:site-specific DNA recombinase
VQEELARRANLKSGDDGSKRLYSSKNDLAGIVFCGECGEIYRRVHWNNRGCKSVVWRCVSRLEEKGSGCESPTIAEEALQQSIVRAINQVIADKDSFLEVLRRNIATVLDEQFDLDTGCIDARLVELQNDLLHLANSGSQYMAVVDEICKLREEKQIVLSQNVDRKTKRQRIVEMTEYLNSQTGVISQYDDKLVRRLVEHVMVINGRVAVGFRSGMEVGVEI